MTVKNERYIFWLLIILLCSLYFILPSLWQTIFASPDETSYAYVAHEIADHGRAFVRDDITQGFPWIHPRSWISRAGIISPVGFLGWPMILSIFALVGGISILPFVGALLILSSVWPFYRLLRRTFCAEAALVAVAVTYTIPSIILYANRSLFPNGPLVAMIIWGLWILQYIKDHPSVKHGWYVFFGAWWMSTLLFRPIEVFWIAPWIWFFSRGWTMSRFQIKLVGLGALVILVPFIVLSKGAYGSWFGFGYGKSDSVPIIISNYNPQPTNYKLQTTSYKLLPYGFHIKNIIWNFRMYFGWPMLPWTLISIFALIIYFDRRRLLARVRRDDIFLILCAWTLFILLIWYGSGVYLDRFSPRKASLANSFLRYHLPMVPLFGVAFAFFYHRLMRDIKWKSVVRGVGLFLVMFGVYISCFVGDESLLRTRQELIKYKEIRALTSQWFSPGDVILSERSDKIFFPAFRAVSPIPSEEQIIILARERSIRIGLFTSALLQWQKDAWMHVGLEAQEVAAFGNECLYRLKRIE